MTTITHELSDESHAVRGFFTLLFAAVLAGGMVLALTAGVGAIWSAVGSTPAARTASGATADGGHGGSMAAAAPVAAQTPVSGSVTIQIKDVSTPEGPEPAFVGPSGVGAPILFTTRANQSLRVVVENADMMPHTFTAPGLGLNVSIAPGSTTTFNFTPTTTGSFSFECKIPCGGWVMSHAGYMKGTVEVEA